MNEIACSFCEKDHRATRNMIKGPPGHNICDACVLHCVDILLASARDLDAPPARLAAVPMHWAGADREAERFLVDRVAELRASIPIHVVDAEVVAWCHGFIDEWDRAVRAEARRGGEEVGDAYDALTALYAEDKAAPHRRALLSFAGGIKPNRPSFAMTVRALALGYGTWVRT